MALQHRPHFGSLERPFDDRALLAGPDQLGGGPFAQKEAQSVYEYGLSGARFSREQREPFSELELQRGDKRDVVDS